MLPGTFQGAYEERSVSPKFARGLLRAGLGAFKVQGFGGAGSRNSTDPGEVFQIPSPSGAVDVDAIGSAVSSATGLKTVGSGVTAGVVTSDMQPARKLTVTFDASTDWDATVAVITYVNNEGKTVSENLAVATSTTATTVGYAKSFVSLSIPAQTGSGGTATIGISAMSALTIADFAGVVLRQSIKTMVNPSNLYIGPTSDGITNANTLAHYVDGDTVPCVRRGLLSVFTEEATSDMDPVYMRIASGAGGSLLGAFRNDADTASCVLVTGARFVRDQASGVGVVHLGLGY
ncbi:MAG: hypothetical protein RLZZ450_61 [Pseudomonadota bacterium]|jgi:hypothetical protein